MRYWSSNDVFKLIDYYFVTHRAPTFLGYLWNFGVFAFLCLFIQIITGLFLAIHYHGSTVDAFISVEHIMRDVNNGWFLRYAHANGASFFFIVVYIHILRGIYYGSYAYPRQHLWYAGIIIFLLMIITAFLGYVLPWGQMSFWAATVITNMVSAVPYVGTDLVNWIWGGFSVGAPTLTRFYALHFLLPFIILAFVLLHVYLLHKHGSNNPLGIQPGIDDNFFFPYYIIKDIFAIVLFVFCFGIVVFFYPNLLGHPDNYIPANPLVTPSHIVPEWYFLPFYAILRSIPDKLYGVVAMLGAIVSLGILPILHNPGVTALEFRPLSKILFWCFVNCCFILGWIGSQAAKYPYVQIGQFATIFYFAYLWSLAPIVIALEDRLHHRALVRHLNNLSFTAK
jgi:quinol-cytochrome oxidoreductase complex cytochrome b subunit